MNKFKILSVNEGHCIVLYKTENQSGERIIYGLHDYGRGEVKFYRCTQDGEPQCETNIKKEATISIETPKGNSRLETLIREYINNNPQMIGL